MSEQGNMNEKKFQEIKMPTTHSFVIYTIEGQTFSPSGKEVENLQILGFGDGKNEEDAVNRLLSEQPWILEKGFSKEAIRSRQIL